MSKLVLICLSTMIAFSNGLVFGLPPFKKAFDKKYVKNSDNADFKAAFKKQGCNVCHIKGEKKDKNNPYGKELAKLIEGNAKQRTKEASDDEKANVKKQILKELAEAFSKVEKIKNEDDEAFGDRIKSGKLPVEG